MWRFVRAVVAAVGFVGSVAGFLLFVALAVGVWWAKAEANRRADALAARAHAAADTADHAVGFVRGVVTQAEADLARAREATPEPAEPVHPLVQIGAQQASHELAGSVDRANVAVATASDAVVVANTALELFDKDAQLQGWFGVRPEEVAYTRAELSAATRDLTKARTVLGIPVAAGGPPTAEQLNTIAAGLARARAFTDQMGAAVAGTRARVVETKVRVDRWVGRAAVAVTALGALAAAGQLLAARFWWRVLRGRPA